MRSVNSSDKMRLLEKKIQTVETKMSEKLEKLLIDGDNWLWPLSAPLFVVQPLFVWICR